MTKADLARMAEVDQSTLSRLEADPPKQYNLSAANKARIAQVLGVTAVDLDRMTHEDGEAPAHQPTFEEYVHNDPTLTPKQVEALLMIYRQFFRQE